MKYLVKATQTLHIEALIDATTSDEACEMFLAGGFLEESYIVTEEDPVVEFVERAP